MKIFVIKDMKAGLFLAPFAQANVTDALRGWEAAANEGDSMIRRYPNDFRLFEIGEFDQNTGDVSLLKHHHDLGSAADAVRPSQPNISQLPFTGNQ